MTKRTPVKKEMFDPTAKPAGTPVAKTPRGGASGTPSRGKGRPSRATKQAEADAAALAAAARAASKGKSSHPMQHQFLLAQGFGESNEGGEDDDDDNDGEDGGDETEEGQVEHGDGDGDGEGEGEGEDEEGEDEGDEGGDEDEEDEDGNPTDDSGAGGGYGSSDLLIPSHGAGGPAQLKGLAAYGQISRKKKAGKPVLPAFLTKLYEIVEDKGGAHSAIIRWGDKGSSFVVLDEQALSKHILPKFFKHNNFSSFVRQLNMYGFRKIKIPNSNTWEYQHDNFVRGKRERLAMIKRRWPGATLVTGALLSAGAHPGLSLKVESELLAAERAETAKLRLKLAHYQEMVEALIREKRELEAKIGDLNHLNRAYKYMAANGIDASLQGGNGGNSNGGGGLNMGHLGGGMGGGGMGGGVGGVGMVGGLGVSRGNGNGSSGGDNMHVGGSHGVNGNGNGSNGGNGQGNGIGIGIGNGGNSNSINNSNSGNSNNNNNNNGVMGSIPAQGNLPGSPVGSPRLFSSPRLESVGDDTSSFFTGQNSRSVMSPSRMLSTNSLVSAAAAAAALEAAMNEMMGPGDAMGDVKNGAASAPAVAAAASAAASEGRSGGDGTLGSTGSGGGGGVGASGVSSLGQGNGGSNGNGSGSNAGAGGGGASGLGALGSGSGGRASVTAGMPFSQNGRTSVGPSGAGGPGSEEGSVPMPPNLFSPATMMTLNPGLFQVPETPLSPLNASGVAGQLSPCITPYIGASGLGMTNMSGSAAEAAFLSEPGGSKPKEDDGIDLLSFVANSDPSPKQPPSRHSRPPSTLGGALARNAGAAAIAAAVAAAAAAANAPASTTTTTTTASGGTASHAHNSNTSQLFPDLTTGVAGVKKRGPEAGSVFDTRPGKKA